MPDKVMRVCSCGCGGELHGRWPYLRGHNKNDGAKSAHKRIDRLVDHVNREIGVAADIPLHDQIAGCGECTNERVITLQLGESKVQKLLNLLLA